MLPMIATAMLSCTKATYACTDSPPFGFELYPEVDGAGSAFMWTRGQRWFHVDDRCGLEVWQGHGPQNEEWRPLARRDLTETEYADLRERVGVDAWDRHEDDAFQGDEGEAFRGGAF